MSARVSVRGSSLPQELLPHSQAGKGKEGAKAKHPQSTLTTQAILLTWFLCQALK